MLSDVVKSSMKR